MREALLSVLGVGQTAFTRVSGRSVAALAAEAARLALDDAGVDADALRVVVPVGGHVFADDLVAELGVARTVVDALPAPGGNSGVVSLEVARGALSAAGGGIGLVVFARNGRSATRIAKRVGSLPGQVFRAYLEQPHGWSTPAQWYAMIAQRYVHEFGPNRDAMAEVALAANAHAQLNPAAMNRGRVLTREAYDAGRVVADPYTRYDCCLETDGAVALVVTVDAPRGSRVVDVVGIAAARPQSPDDLTNRLDWLDIGLSVAAPLAYERAGLGPEDVDAAMIYDCFTFEVLHQLEEAGLCPRGESARLVRSGGIRLGGRLPVNTHGGLLAEGHLGGVNHLLEAVRQLRHEVPEERQVHKVRTIAVTGWGDWGDGSLALLQKGRTS